MRAGCTCPPRMRFHADNCPTYPGEERPRVPTPQEIQRGFRDMGIAASRIVATLAPMAAAFDGMARSLREMRERRSS